MGVGLGLWLGLGLGLGFGLGSMAMYVVETTRAPQPLPSVCRQKRAWPTASR